MCDHAFLVRDDAFDPLSVVALQYTVQNSVLLFPCFLQFLIAVGGVLWHDMKRLGS